MRLRRLEAEFAGRIEIAWKSYLLRPEPSEGRDLAKFRAYTTGWAKPAAEPDGGTFRAWESDAGPPSHSVPPHAVARAAAEIGREAFDLVHERLFRAYFTENRDITDERTLREIWRECALPDAAFERTHAADIEAAGPYAPITRRRPSSACTGFPRSASSRTRSSRWEPTRSTSTVAGS